jgi:hypothetical protein
VGTRAGLDVMVCLTPARSRTPDGADHSVIVILTILSKNHCSFEMQGTVYTVSQCDIPEEWSCPGGM